MPFRAVDLDRQIWTSSLIFLGILVPRIGVYILVCNWPAFHKVVFLIAETAFRSLFFLGQNNLSNFDRRIHGSGSCR